MDPTVVTVIVVAVVVLIVVGLVGLLRRRTQATERREHLQDRFGPEYDRAVEDADDQRQAESRLEAAERRRDELDIQPLTAASRRRRMQEWDAVQATFVDTPVEAVDGADRLVADVMAERGYPTGAVDDKLSMLAADHAETVQHYRTAESHRTRFHSGEGSTEDLRRAFVEYRRLFDVLVEDGSAASGTHDVVEPVGQHAARPAADEAARPAADEVDLRDSRDPAPTATPVRPDGAGSSTDDHR